jgi:hypothetical protein
LFSWTDVTAFSMCQSLTGEGFLYDIAREMREKTGDNVDYLESLIDGYRRAERWAELAVNDFANDTGRDARNFLEYESYRAIAWYVMDWLEDAEAELRHDIKQGPIMGALICHEMGRCFNTLRIQAGLEVFW